VKEDLLEDFLGLSRVPDDPLGEAQEAGGVAVVENPEGLGVPGLDPGD
jgi:hypothetical protein